MQVTDGNPSDIKTIEATIYHLSDALLNVDYVITPPAGKFSALKSLSFTVTTFFGGFQRGLVLQASVSGTIISISAHTFTIPGGITFNLSFSSEKPIPSSSANYFSRAPLPPNLFLTDTDEIILHVINANALDAITDIVATFDETNHP